MYIVVLTVLYDDVYMYKSLHIHVLFCTVYHDITLSANTFNKYKHQVSCDRNDFTATTRLKPADGDTNSIMLFGIWNLVISKYKLTPDVCLLGQHN